MTPLILAAVLAAHVGGHYRAPPQSPDHACPFVHEMRVGRGLPGWRCVDGWRLCWIDAPGPWRDYVRDAAEAIR